MEHSRSWNALHDATYSVSCIIIQVEKKNFYERKNFINPFYCLLRATATRKTQARTKTLSLVDIHQAYGLSSHKILISSLYRYLHQYHPSHPYHVTTAWCRPRARALLQPCLPWELHRSRLVYMAHEIQQQYSLWDWEGEVSSKLWTCVNAIELRFQGIQVFWFLVLSFGKIRSFDHLSRKGWHWRRRGIW